jgi:hypothetical protein
MQTLLTDNPVIIEATQNEGVWGFEGKTPLIVNLSIKKRCGQLHVSPPAQSNSGNFGEKRNLFDSSGNRTMVPRSFNPELSRLHTKFSVFHIRPVQHKRKHPVVCAFVSCLRFSCDCVMKVNQEIRKCVPDISSAVTTSLPDRLQSLF